MRKWAAGLGLVVVVATACGTDATPSDSVTAGDPGPAPTTTGSGEGFTFQILGPAESLERLTGPVPGDLRLDGCRWLGPASYEFDFTWMPAESGTVVLPVLLELIEPANDTPPGIPVELVLDAPASFTVPVDTSWRYQHDDAEQWSFNRVHLVNETNARCGGFVPGADATSFGSDLDLAPVVPVADTQTELVLAAAAIDATDSNDPLLPLAWMIPAVAAMVDSYAFVDGATLEGVGVEREGTCVSIFSTFTLGDGSTIHLLQRGGCSAAAPPDQVAYPGFVPPAVLEGEGWTVTVTPGSAEIAWLGEATPANEDPTFSPAAWLGAYRGQHRDIDVLAVFEWEGGLVAVVDSHQIEVERYADPVVITPEEYHGGSSGTVCDSWGYNTSGHAGRSYIFVVAHEPGLQFDIGSEHEFVWQTTADGREVGFADLQGASVDQPTVTDADGTDVPCVQSAG